MTLDTALRTAWRDTLGAPPASGETDFFVAGGDSLLLVRMVAQLRRDGVGIAPVDVLAGRTFAGILARLTPAAAVAETATVGTGPVGLLPTQSRWLSNAFTEPDRFNLGDVFQLPTELSTADIEKAVGALVDRHEALRTRYTLDGTAEVLAEPPGPVLTEVTGEDDVAAVLRAGNGRHRLADGAVVSAQWLPKTRLLQVAVHHLTLDGYSTGVLADDLENLLLGRPVGAAPGQPGEQAEAIHRWLDSDEAAKAATQWRALGWDQVRPVPTDTTGPGHLPSMAIISGEMPAAGVTEHTDLLVAAAACHAIGARFALPAVSVDVYHHGRDQLPGGPDLTNSIGYFQSSFPVVFGVGGGWLTRATADLDRVPAARFGFDALRFGGVDGLSGLPTSGVRLNFRGRMNDVNAREGAWLRPAEVEAGGRRSPKQTEPYVLMLEGDLIGDRLVFSIKYSTDHYREDTIHHLVAETLRLLADPAARP